MSMQLQIQRSYSPDNRSNDLQLICSHQTKSFSSHNKWQLLRIKLEGPLSIPAGPGQASTHLSILLISLHHNKKSIAYQVFSLHN